MTYEQARDTMAGWLDRHAQNSPSTPHAGYDEIDAGLPRDSSDPKWKKLFVALTFWDSWIDASNHEWRYYEPLKADDWPRLARSIAEDLRNDHDLKDIEELKRVKLAI
jgi:hypothetical protein